MSLVVAVLGMHRSGTSCLTHLLRHAGMHLGINLMSASHSSNLESHLEAWEAVHINDRILELSGGAWDRVPDTLRADEQIDRRIVAFLDQLRQHPVCGWKDPRSTITFPLWKPHLGPYRIVAALRHPMSVARSLEIRDGLPPEKGLRLWYLYNERLLRYADQDPWLYLFDYDQPEQELTHSLQALCRHVHLQWTPAVGDVFNAFLRHHTCSQMPGDEATRRLYEALRERARCHARTAILPNDGRASEELPAPDGGINWLADLCRSMNGQISKLVRIHQLQNALMQEQSRWQVDVMQQHAVWQAAIGELRQRQDQCIERVGMEIASLQLKQQEQASQLLECQRFVLRVRNSLVLRLRRALVHRASALRTAVGRWIARGNRNPAPSRTETAANGQIASSATASSAKPRQASLAARAPWRPERQQIAHVPHGHPGQI